MNPLAIYFLAFAVIIVFAIVVCAVSAYLSKKRLTDAVESLNLVCGNHYDITLRNGNKHLNVTYSRISYGNKSKNGNINLYFTKNSKEIMIKYDTISQVTHAAVSTQTTTKQPVNNARKESAVDKYIDEINKGNAHSAKIAEIQVYVRENYRNMSAKEIYDQACKMATYDRPTLYCAVNLHYGLIELINLIYKLRDSDDEALDYCLKMCDMDIPLYDDVYKATSESINNFVYDGALKRKVLILEKQQEYEAAVKLCDFALSCKYFKNDRLDDYRSRKVKLQNKLMKHQINKIVED